MPPSNQPAPVACLSAAVRPSRASPGLSAFAQANVGLRGALFASRATFKPLVRPPRARSRSRPPAATSAADIALVKQVIEATRKGKEADADAAENRSPIRSPASSPNG